MPSSQDIARAKALPELTCPRRYCWYWRSFEFEWDDSPAQGCDYLKMENKKKSYFKHNDKPCVRSDPAGTDHFEARTPLMTKDGVAPPWYARLDDWAEESHLADL